MSHYLSIRNKDGNYDKHKVPEEVYIYVKQMEAYITYPQISKFLEKNPQLANKTVDSV